MSQPALNKTQRDVLMTVRWQPRDERWNHTTLNYLRSLGLVESAPIETAAGRPSRAVYRWSITDLGREVYGLKPGTPLPSASARAAPPTPRSAW